MYWMITFIALLTAVFINFPCNYTFCSAFCDKLSSGKARILFDANIEDYCAIAVTALDTTKWDNLDEINADYEAVRIAASSGVKALQSLVSSTKKVLIIIHIITF